MMNLDLPPETEIKDIDAWCQDALMEAILCETNPRIRTDFSVSLGELVARRAGVDITPLEDR